MTFTAARQPSLGRCLTVWSAVSLAAGCLLGWLLPHLLDPPVSGQPWRFDTALLLGCEAVAASSVCWLWLLVTLILRDVLRGRDPRAARGLPIPVRRLVLSACGLSLAAGAAAPAHAGRAVEVDPERATVERLVGLSVPDRVATPQRVRAVRPQPRSRVPQSPPVVSRPPVTSPGLTVVVAVGDTLWAIAVRTLPAHATAREVDRRWREIYRANAANVGPDPHLIRPGQRLSLPSPQDHREE